MKVPFFRPEITEEEIAEVSDSLRSGWLTTGPKVKQFEQEFAQAVGAKFAVALNSCTAALHLALEAVGVKRGDMVIVPTMTFAATAEVVRYFDAVPVMVDCDPRTLCMDPQQLRHTIEALLSEQPVAGLKPPYGRLKVIIPMHYGGYACSMVAIMDMADFYGLNVIEDSAHAFPAAYRPPTADTGTTIIRSTPLSNGYIPAGRFGRVGCFSFYANKCITTGEGGMAVTDDERIADRMRLMSLHGMDRDAWKRFTAEGSWYYELVAPGYKYNLTDLAAGLGLHQLRKAEQLRLARERIAQSYNRAFASISELETPVESEDGRTHSYHLYPLRLNLDKLTIDRAQFIEELKARGVLCSVHWLPLHLHPYYRETYGMTEGLFPVAEREWLRLVSLPIFPAQREEEVEHVIRSVIDVVTCNRR